MTGVPRQADVSCDRPRPRDPGGFGLRSNDGFAGMRGDDGRVCASPAPGGHSALCLLTCSWQPRAGTALSNNTV